MDFQNCKIPTRFDDIQKEIHFDKMKDYYVQAKVPQVEQGSTFKLGDVLGDKLNKIL
ncbi:hypothetical protein IKU74_03745 [bacterium]|nr:hypothetical protein [bacterium]